MGNPVKKWLDFYLNFNKYYSYLFEHSHLEIIEALQANGTLTEAADILCLSPAGFVTSNTLSGKEVGVSPMGAKGTWLTTYSGRQVTI